MRELITQTNILLANIETTLTGLDEKYFNNKSIFQWTIGEQFYHLLSSMDNWFINPSLKPIESRNSKDISENELKKEFLISYFGKIKEKILSYLINISNSELNKKPENCPYSRLELIFGQCRHAMYHIGFIHACIRIKFGSAPKYIGLDTYISNNEK